VGAKGMCTVHTRVAMEGAWRYAAGRDKLQKGAAASLRAPTNITGSRHQAAAQPNTASDIVEQLRQISAAQHTGFRKVRQ
jgi:hypothetical protein